MHAAGETHELRERLRLPALRRDDQRVLALARRVTRHGTTPSRCRKRHPGCSGWAMAVTIGLRSVLLRTRSWGEPLIVWRGHAGGGAQAAETKQIRPRPHGIDHELDVLRRVRRPAPARLLRCPRDCTPRANALSFIFFRTDRASTSCRLFDGRTSAVAVISPVSSSTANSVFAISVRAVRRCIVAWPRIACSTSLGTAALAQDPHALGGMLRVGRCAR